MRVGTPLPALAAGGITWAEFVDRFGDYEEFQGDMNDLRDLGLVQFSNKDFSGATVTNRGRDVAELLDAGPETLLSQEPGAETSINELSEGTTLVEFALYSNAWFRFRAPSRGRFELSTQGSGANVDPILSARVGSFEDVVAVNDDGGGG